MWSLSMFTNSKKQTLYDCIIEEKREW